MRRREPTAIAPPQCALPPEAGQGMWPPDGNGRKPLDYAGYKTKPSQSIVFLFWGDMQHYRSVVPPSARVPVVGRADELFSTRVSRNDLPGSFPVGCLQNPRHSIAPLRFTTVRTRWRRSLYCPPNILSQSAWICN